MRNFILLAVMGVTLACSGFAHAADDKKTDDLMKIGVVDVQSLMGKSKAGKSIETQVNKQRDSLKNEFANLEKDLSALQKGLEKVDPKSAEFETKRKELEKKMIEANRLVQQRRQSLDVAAAKAVAELEKSIVMTVGDIAKDDHYALVVRTQSVVVAGSALDITDKVLVALDKKISNIKVDTDAAKPAAAAPEEKKK